MASEIAEQLKCNRCEDYLLPPIIQCIQGHILCNNCWEGKEDCPKCRNNFMPLVNKALGKIASKILFPCPFAIKGCIAYLKWTEIVQHKMECVFRCTSCPLADQNRCRWKGFDTDLISHFFEHHGDACNTMNEDNEVVFYLDLSDPYHNVSLIQASYQSFLLHTIRTCKTNHTLLVLQYIGAPAAAAKYQFQLELRNLDDTKLCIFKAPVVPTNIDVTKTNNRIRISDSQLFEIEETCCSLKINEIIVTEADQVSSSQLTSEELVKEIECPVCTMHMSAPIFQCDRGHSICGNCRPQIEQCPTCSGSISTVRNYTLESLVSKLRVPCPFTELGCTRNGSAEEMRQHEALCDFAKEECLHCSRREKIEKILEHAENEHEMMERGYSVWPKLLVNVRSVLKRVIDHNNQLLFWYAIRDMERNSIHFIIKTYDTNLKCKYTVKLRDENNDRRIANTEYICTDYKKSLEEIIRSGKCVSIPLHKAQTFLCEDGNLKFHLYLDKFENEKSYVVSSDY